MRALLIFAGAVGLLLAGAVDAHVVAEQTSRVLGEAVLLSLLFGTGAWYLIGYLRVRRLAQSGRARLARHGVLFAGGWSTIALSLLTPLHELGGRSFTAHMIEHELLMLLAAPLIALSRPIGVLMWAWPASLRLAAARLSRQSWFNAVWRSISSPLGASLLQAAMLWLWHAPAFFDRALASEGWHATQHLSLLFSALLFWWAINGASSLRHRHGVAAFWLFFTSMHSGLLGALMALSASPWYSRYVAMGMSGTAGLTPLEDQQIAGLIMWIPGGAVHAIVALIYLSRWFRPRLGLPTLETFS
jgi:putative membrane protein